MALERSVEQFDRQQQSRRRARRDCPSVITSTALARRRRGTFSARNSRSCEHLRSTGAKTDQPGSNGGTRLDQQRFAIGQDELPLSAVGFKSIGSRSPPRRSTRSSPHPATDHGGGWSTYYAHLRVRSAALKAQVSRGQKIGEVGNTSKPGNNICNDGSLNSGPRAVPPPPSTVPPRRQIAAPPTRSRASYTIGNGASQSGHESRTALHWTAGSTCYTGSRYPGDTLDRRDGAVASSHPDTVGAVNVWT
nr:M23 family metallopeptidase [Kibdelosporangium persicum]